MPLVLQPASGTAKAGIVWSGYFTPVTILTPPRNLLDQVGMLIGQMPGVVSPAVWNTAEGSLLTASMQFAGHYTVSSGPGRLATVQFTNGVPGDLTIYDGPDVLGTRIFGPQIPYIGQQWVLNLPIKTGITLDSDTDMGLIITYFA